MIVSKAAELHTHVKQLRGRNIPAQQRQQQEEGHEARIHAPGVLQLRQLRISNQHQHDDDNSATSKDRHCIKCRQRWPCWELAVSTPFSEHLCILLSHLLFPPPRSGRLRALGSAESVHRQLWQRDV